MEARSIEIIKAIMEDPGDGYFPIFVDESHKEQMALPNMICL